MDIASSATLRETPTVPDKLELSASNKVNRNLLDYKIIPKSKLPIYPKLFLIVGIIIISLVILLRSETINFDFLCNEKKSISAAKKSVVKIVTKQSVGSGFVIDSSGYILTNFHVIDGDANPQIYFDDNTSVQGKVYNWDDTIDLAIVSVTKTDLNPLLFREKRLNVGQDIIAIGFPFGFELEGEATVTKGIYSASRIVNGIEVLQFDTPINSGNSGGPAIDKCTKVVGVNTAVLEESQGLGFAISTNIAEAFARSLIILGPKDFEQFLRDEETKRQQALNECTGGVEIDIYVDTINKFDNSKQSEFRDFVLKKYPNLSVAQYAEMESFMDKEIEDRQKKIDDAINCMESKGYAIF